MYAIRIVFGSGGSRIKATYNTLAEAEAACCDIEMCEIVAVYIEKVSQ